MTNTRNDAAGADTEEEEEEEGDATRMITNREKYTPPRR